MDNEIKTVLETIGKKDFKKLSKLLVQGKALEEIKAFAENEKIELNEAQLGALKALMEGSKELTDEELDSVVGGKYVS